MKLKDFLYWATLMLWLVSAIAWFASALIGPPKLKDYPTPASENANSFRRIRALYAAIKWQSLANAIAAACAGGAALLTAWHDKLSN